MVDASAILAILLAEADGEEFSARLSKAENPFTSPLAIYETVLRLMQVHPFTVITAQAAVRTLLTEREMSVISVTDEMTTMALDAFHRYGRGRHPAALNFGDCFAYACARAHDAPLLYKGNDFARTDLA